MAKKPVSDPEKLAFEIAGLAKEKKGEKILILNVGKLTSLTDYFVIASGANDRQTKAIAKNIIDKLKDEGIKPSNVHGATLGQWVAIDYGSVIVHVFRDEERKFYELERLWKDAKVVN